MGRGLAKPRRYYALDQSPFYKLQSRRKLTGFLRWNGTAAELSSFAGRLDNYQEFNRDGRDIQAPKDKLERLHRRIANLVVRVNLPDYLHSGRRGRSYVTNGRAHANGLPAIKLDVRKFYPSTKREHVYRWFRDELKCSPDVAELLASVACFHSGCLPTGSCLSQLLAFHVHRSMFDAIEEFAQARGGVLTVYVDDIVISMSHASWNRLSQVGRFIEKQGLAWHKARLYPTGAVKVVTGTVVKGLHMEAPNHQHQKLKSTMDECAAIQVDDPQRVGIVQRALGIAQSIAQVDPRRHLFAQNLPKILNSTQ